MSTSQNSFNARTSLKVGSREIDVFRLDALTKAAKSGVVVVRSTRLAEGIVLRNNEVNDDEKGFVASGELNPAKSRVLLQLALTKTNDPVRIQKMFYEYCPEALRERE